MSEKDEELDDMDLGDDDDLDLDMDLDEADFGLEEVDSESRSPTSGVIGDAGASFLEDFSEDKTRTLLDVGKAAIPETLSSDTDVLVNSYDSITDEFRNQKSKITKEAKRTLRTLKAFTPDDENALGNRIINKVSSFLGDDEESSGGNSGPTQAEKIASEMTALMGEQRTAEAESAAVKDQMEFMQNKDVKDLQITSTLNLERMRKFMFEVSDKYYRANLNVQIRQMYTAEELLSVTKTGFEVFKTSLAAITKNTSLPEVVKIHESERIGEDFRRKMSDKLMGGLFSKDSVIDNLTNKATAGLKNAGSAAVDKLADMTGNVEMAATMGEQGMSPGAMLGTIIASEAKSAAGKAIGKVAAKTDAGSEAIFKAKNAFADPREFIKEMDRSDGVKGLLGGFLKAFMGNGKETLKIEQKDQAAAAYLDNRTKDSINKVIPTLLSKIYSEVKTSREISALTMPKNRKGKIAPVESKELVYDNKLDKMISKDEVMSNILTTTGKSAKDNVAKVADSITRELLDGSTQEYTREERTSIRNAIIETALKTGRTNMDLLVSTKFKSLVKPELFSKVRKEYRDIEKKLEGNRARDSVAREKQTSLNSGITSLTTATTNHQEVLNNLVGGGHTQEAIKLGLLEQTESGELRVNRDAFTAMIVEQAKRNKGEFVKKEEEETTSTKDQLKDAVSGDGTVGSKVKNIFSLAAGKVTKAAQQDPEEDARRKEDKQYGRPTGTRAEIEQAHADKINKVLDANRAANGGSFSEGGGTGDGKKDDVAGIVHKNEYVINQTLLDKVMSTLSKNDLSGVSDLLSNLTDDLAANSKRYAKIPDSIQNLIDKLPEFSKFAKSKEPSSEQLSLFGPPEATTSTSKLKDVFNDVTTSVNNTANSAKDYITGMFSKEDKETIETVSKTVDSSKSLIDKTASLFSSKNFKSITKLISTTAKDATKMAEEGINKLGRSFNVSVTGKSSLSNKTKIYLSTIDTDKKAKLTTIVEELLNGKKPKIKDKQLKAVANDYVKAIKEYSKENDISDTPVDKLMSIVGPTVSEKASNLATSTTESGKAFLKTTQDRYEDAKSSVSEDSSVPISLAAGYKVAKDTAKSATGKVAAKAEEIYSTTSIGGMTAKDGVTKATEVIAALHESKLQKSTLKYIEDINENPEVNNQKKTFLNNLRKSLNGGHPKAGAKMRKAIADCTNVINEHIKVNNLDRSKYTVEELMDMVGTPLLANVKRSVSEMVSKTGEVVKTNASKIAKKADLVNNGNKSVRWVEDKLHEKGINAVLKTRLSKNFAKTGERFLSYDSKNKARSLFISNVESLLEGKDISKVSGQTPYLIDLSNEYLKAIQAYIGDTPIKDIDLTTEELMEVVGNTKLDKALDLSSKLGKRVSNSVSKASKHVGGKVTDATDRAKELTEKASHTSAGRAVVNTVTGVKDGVVGVARSGISLTTEKITTSVVTKTEADLYNALSTKDKSIVNKNITNIYDGKPLKGSNKVKALSRIYHKAISKYVLDKKLNTVDYAIEDLVDVVNISTMQMKFRASRDSVTEKANSYFKLEDRSYLDDNEELKTLAGGEQDYVSAWDDFTEDEQGALRLEFFSSDIYKQKLLTKFPLWLRDFKHIDPGSLGTAKGAILGKFLDIKSNLTKKFNSVKDEMIQEVTDRLTGKALKELKPEEEEPYREAFFKSPEYIKGYVKDFKDWLAAMGKRPANSSIFSRIKKKLSLKNILNTTRRWDRAIASAGVHGVGKTIAYAGKSAFDALPFTNRDNPTMLGKAGALVGRTTLKAPLWYAGEVAKAGADTLTAIPGLRRFRRDEASDLDKSKGFVRNLAGGIVKGGVKAGFGVLKGGAKLTGKAAKVAAFGTTNALIDSAYDTVMSVPGLNKYKRDPDDESATMREMAVNIAKDLTDRAGKVAKKAGDKISSSTTAVKKVAKDTYAKEKAEYYKSKKETAVTNSSATKKAAKESKAKEVVKVAEVKAAKESKAKEVVKVATPTEAKEAVVDTTLDISGLLTEAAIGIKNNISEKAELLYSKFKDIKDTHTANKSASVKSKDTISKPLTGRNKYTSHMRKANSDRSTASSKSRIVKGSVINIKGALVVNVSGSKYTRGGIISRGKDAIVNAAKTTRDKIEAKLSDIKTKLSGFKDKHMPNIVGAFTGIKDGITNKLQGFFKSKDLKEKIAAKAKLIKDNVAAKAKMLKDKLSGVKDSATAKAKLIKDKLNVSKSNLAIKAKSALGKLSTAKDNILMRAGVIASGMSKAKDNLISKVKDIRDKLPDAKDLIAEKTKALVGKLATIKDKLADKAGKTKDTIASGAKDIIKFLKSKELRDKFKSKAELIREKLAIVKNKAIEKAKLIRDKLTTAKDAIVNKAKNIKDKLAAVKEATAAKAKLVSDRLTAAKDKIADKMSGIKNKLSGAKTTVATGITKMVGYLKSKDLRDKLADKAKRVGAKLVSIKNKVFSGVNKSMNAMVVNIRGAIVNVSNSGPGKISKLKDSIVNKTKSIRSKLSGAKDKVISKISGMKDTVLNKASSLKDSFVAKAPNISEGISKAKDVVGNATKAIGNTIARAKDGIVGKVIKSKDATAVGVDKLLKFFKNKDAREIKEKTVEKIRRAKEAAYNRWSAMLASSKRGKEKAGGFIKKLAKKSKSLITPITILMGIAGLMKATGVTMSDVKDGVLKTWDAIKWLGTKIANGWEHFKASIDGVKLAVKMIQNTGTILTHNIKSSLSKVWGFGKMKPDAAEDAEYYRATHLAGGVAPVVGKPVTNADGSTTVTRADGSVTTTNLDGTTSTTMDPKASKTGPEKTSNLETAGYVAGAGAGLYAVHKTAGLFKTAGMLLKGGYNVGKYAAGKLKDGAPKPKPPKKTGFFKRVFSKVRKVGSKVVNGAKFAVKMVTKFGKKAYDMALRMFKVLVKFKSKIGKKLVGKAAVKAGVKIAARLVPLAGIALLAVDSAYVVKYLAEGYTFMSAVSKAILGVDLFEDEYKVKTASVDTSVDTKKTGGILSGPTDEASGGNLYNGANVVPFKPVGKYLELPEGVDITGMNPALRSNIINMAKDYYKVYGKPLKINSGYRSMSKQAELYRMLGSKKAAKPGSSLHNYGLAVDIDTVRIKELDQAGLINKYGFTQPLPHESWHLEPIGIQQDIYGAKKDPSSVTEDIRNGAYKGTLGWGRDGFGRGRNPKYYESILGEAKPKENKIHNLAKKVLPENKVVDIDKYRNATQEVDSATTVDNNTTKNVAGSGIKTKEPKPIKIPTESLDNVADIDKSRNVKDDTTVVHKVESNVKVNLDDSKHLTVIAEMSVQSVDLQRQMLNVLGDVSRKLDMAVDPTGDTTTTQPTPITSEPLPKPQIDLTRRTSFM